MTTKRKVVVVDGSNLATEGRSTPSLRQLDEAVRAFLEEFPGTEVIVVVDATFEHRVATGERARVRDAELAGDIVTPPAGAIGRGDAFILKIAQRAGAVVLSNDSFQEFHVEHPWLFEEGRLIGGKPVPTVGWIFAPRNPVRGPRSRTVTKRAVRARSADAVEEMAAADVVAARAAPRRRAAAAKRSAPAEVVPVSPAAASGATGPGTAKKRRAPAVAARRTTPAKQAPPPAAEAQKRSRRASKATATRATPAPAAPTAKAPAPKPAAATRSRPEPVNTTRAYKRLAADFAPGGIVEGEVVQFTSHGAMVSVKVGRTMQVVCYASLAGLGSPPPTRARDVLKKGEKYRFAIVAFDPTRRRAELSLAPA